MSRQTAAQVTRSRYNLARRKNETCANHPCRRTAETWVPNKRVTVPLCLRCARDLARGIVRPTEGPGSLVLKVDGAPVQRAAM